MFGTMPKVFVSMKFDFDSIIQFGYAFQKSRYLNLIKIDLKLYDN